MSVLDDTGPQVIFINVSVWGPVHCVSFSVSILLYSISGGKTQFLKDHSPAVCPTLLSVVLKSDVICRSADLQELSLTDLFYTFFCFLFLICCIQLRINFNRLCCVYEGL